MVAQKSRGDERELRQLVGWLCQSTSVYLVEECKRAAKATFLTVGGRIAHVHSSIDAAIMIESTAHTGIMQVFSIAGGKIYIICYKQNRDRFS